MTAYVPRHFRFADAGYRIECICGDSAPLADNPDIATWEQQEFINLHTPCGGEAA